MATPSMVLMALMAPWAQPARGSSVGESDSTKKSRPTQHAVGLTGAVSERP